GSRDTSTSRLPLVLTVHSMNGSTGGGNVIEAAAAPDPNLDDCLTPLHVTFTTLTGLMLCGVSHESIVALFFPSPPQISSAMPFCALMTSLPLPAEICVPSPRASVTFSWSS